MATKIAVLASLLYLFGQACSRELARPLEAEPIVKFPPSFEISYNYTLPYVKSVQSNGLSYPVTIKVDGPSGMSKMDVLNGLDTVLHRNGKAYIIGPHMDHKTCTIVNDGPIITILNQEVLPDVAEWEFEGEDVVNDVQCRKYVLKDKQYGRTEKYRFWVDEEGVPVRLSALGQDYWSGSHFDVYVADFYGYKPGPQPEGTFDLPETCEGAASDEGPLRNAVYRFSALLPSPLIENHPIEDPDYQQFLKKQAEELKHTGKQHALGMPLHPQQRHFRTAIFHQNLHFINKWNEENQSTNKHKLAVNKFADWHEEEFKAIALGRMPGPPPQSNKDHEIPYSPEADPKDIPDSVFYCPEHDRGLTVKDQAVCGSCWAFGATGAMESAWKKATGETVNLSEQHLVDCSYKYHNEGCNGGWQSRAIDMVIDHGGIYEEEDYQYIGNNDFCHEKDSEKRRIKFKGYTNVPPMNKAALREALYSQGPLTVGLDATDIAFRFYSSGVYYNPQCCWWSPWCLDHAVLAVGYGVDNHDPYIWLQNSWSSYWGDNGYIKMSTENDCGVSLQATYAIAEDQST